MITKIKLLVFSFWLLVFSLASAQTPPKFLITWRASNYAPSDFAGKILPVPKSAVAVSLELIDGSRIADIASNEIRWFVNNELRHSGRGVKNFSFVLDDFDRDDQLVRVDIINYKNSDLSETITVPIGQPEVSVKKIGGDLFTALPYFFNVNRPEQLTYLWRANNQTPFGTPSNPWLLSLDASPLPKGATLNVSVEVTNPIDELERAIGQLIVVK